MTSVRGPRNVVRLATGALAVPVIFAAMMACAVNATPEQPPALPSTVEPRDPVAVARLAGDAGVMDGNILFGQSAAFSGPARELGQNMRLGIEAAFHEVNERGGVYGRRLVLESLDDAYEPEAAIANTRRLVEEREVFALIGAVGTPTSRSAAPLAADAGVPYVAPFTGAAFLRDPQWTNVVNLRASYHQETEEMVARLTADLGINRIAIMYQDDSFGRAGYVGVREALARRDMEPAAIGLYPRNTTAIKTALLDLIRGAPEAVILVGAYQPVGELIAWARHVGIEPEPVFMTLSFVGSNALAEQLGPDGAGVYVTQVVPFPTGEGLPVVSAYRRALSAYAPSAAPGFVSFEGYLAGRLAIFGLEACRGQVSRACFLDSLRNARAIDLDGFQLAYGGNDNQGSDAVFLTAIGGDGAYHPVDTLRDAGP